MTFHRRRSVDVAIGIQLGLCLHRHVMATAAAAAADGELWRQVQEDWED